MCACEQGGERFGRYSFIGLHAHTLLRVKGNRTEVVTDGKVVETNEGNPLDFIAAFERRQKVALRPGLPRFCGGLAGYFGYDAVRFIEPRLAETAPPDDLQLPDIQLMLCEEPCLNFTATPACEPSCSDGSSVKKQKKYLR